MTEQEPNMQQGLHTGNKTHRFRRAKSLAARYHRVCTLSVIYRPGETQDERGKRDEAERCEPPRLLRFALHALEPDRTTKKPAPQTTKGEAEAFKTLMKRQLGLFATEFGGALLRVA